MHLLPCIFREHLTTIGGNQGSEDLSTILLQGLRILLGSFPELAYKPELDETIVLL